MARCFEMVDGATLIQSLAGYSVGQVIYEIAFYIGFLLFHVHSHQ
jgi:hypothetical protein